MSAPIYYQSDRVTLHHGDALEVLPELGTESVDLVVTDPPYGVEWESGRRAERFGQLFGDERTNEARQGIAAILAECVRVVGQRRHLYVFGPADVLEGLKVSQGAELIWDKATKGLGDTAGPWAPAHEPITFAVSLHGHVGETGSETGAARLRKGSIIRATRPTGLAVRHPSEKPTALLAELVESSSRQGELVLDPFAGVGSTGVAAVLAGRRTILVEQDLRYVRIARERLIAADRIRDAAEET